MTAKLRVDDVRGELTRMARGELLPYLTDRTRERIRAALERAEERDRSSSAPDRDWNEKAPPKPSQTARRPHRHPGRAQR